MKLFNYKIPALIAVFMFLLSNSVLASSACESSFTELPEVEVMQKGSKEDRMEWLKLAFQKKDRDVVEFLLVYEPEISSQDQRQILSAKWLNRPFVDRQFSKDYQRAIDSRLEFKELAKAIRATTLYKELDLMIAKGNTTELLSNIISDKYKQYLLSDLESAKQLAEEKNNPEVAQVLSAIIHYRKNRKQLNRVTMLLGLLSLGVFLHVLPTVPEILINLL